MFISRFLPCSLFLTLFLIHPASGAGRTLLVPTDPASGVKIEIESWLDACPPGGMAAFKMRITNASGKVRDWSLSATDGYNRGTTTTISASAPSGATVEIPFVACAGLRDSSGISYRTLNFTMTGHGVRGFAGQLQQPDTLSRGSHSSATPFLAMSSQLAAKGWSPLADKFDKAAASAKGGGAALDATQVDMARAPDDWRGYSSLSQIWMTEGEWSAMSGGAKAALTEWLAMGGRAVIFAADLAEDKLAGLKLPPPGADGGRRIGAGRILTRLWDGKELPLDEAFKLASQKDALAATKRLADYGGSAWKLRDAVAAPALRALLIFGFILGFGILVGPVNLYWLAKPGRRQRLFWTTPLISLAGSAVLVALMILQDGIGGTGARRLVALMLPEQNKIALIQEQISRTGVLLGRSFAIEEPSWMQQVSAFGSSGYSPGGDDERHFLETDQRLRGGDWFANRAIQAQAIAAVRPSRGRIELFPGATENDPPLILSSLGAQLAQVFVIDDRKRVWRAGAVGTGEKKAMQPSSEADFRKWLASAALDELGPLPAGPLQEISRLPGQAFAESAEASKFAVKTLGAVRWNDDRVIFAGPYVKH